MDKKRQAHPPATAESRELLKSIIRFMKLNQQLSLHELVNLYADISPEETVPVSIFSSKLSPSEALCKYLKENRSLSFHEIAILLNRDDRSIWTSYERASRKSKKSLSTKKEDLLIPLTIFTDRSLSILEHITHHLKTAHDLSNSRIAELTKKNPSSIATVAKRAITKRQENTKGNSKNA
jgi:hypothetical protein